MPATMRDYDRNRPRGDAKIWRYMSVSKYLSLVSTRQLYFARADLLGDPFEGAIGISRVRTSYSAPGSIFGTTAPREKVYISCWHEQSHELAAMWSVYGVLGESVAIRSTFGALVHTLPDSVVVGRVRYTDFSKLPPEAHDERTRYFFKRRSFSTDRELRAIEFKDAGRKTPGRAHIIDLNSVIDAIYVAPGSPDFFRDAIANVSQEYRLAAPVKRSSLDKGAIY